MKKLLAPFALIAGGVFFAPSASATCAGNDSVCIQRMTTIGALHNDPSLCAYGYNPNCYPNQSGGSSRGGGRQPSTFNWPLKSNVTATCRPAQDVHQICEYHNIKTGKLDFITGENQNGDNAYMVGYQDGKITFKAVYEYQKTKHGTLTKETVYHGNGQLDHIAQQVHSKTHDRELSFYDSDGELTLIEHRQMGEIVYSQEYHNNKKHGKERHYTGSANEHVVYEMDWANGVKHGKEYHYDKYDKVVIYEANWANDVKHGEEKIYKKYRGYGTPQIKKTVMWQNGNQVH